MLTLTPVPNLCWLSQDTMHRPRGELQERGVWVKQAGLLQEFPCISGKLLSLLINPQQDGPGCYTATTAWCLAMLVPQMLLGWHFRLKKSNAIHMFPKFHSRLQLPIQENEGQWQL